MEEVVGCCGIEDGRRLCEAVWERQIKKSVKKEWVRNGGKRCIVGKGVGGEGRGFRGVGGKG